MGAHPKLSEIEEIPSNLLLNSLHFCAKNYFFGGVSQSWGFLNKNMPGGGLQSLGSLRQQLAFSPMLYVPIMCVFFRVLDHVSRVLIEQPI